MRPVINLKSLNEYIFPRHFKIKGSHTLKDLIKGNDWMTKVDMKDAYFIIPIRGAKKRMETSGDVQHSTLLHP